MTTVRVCDEREASYEYRRSSLLTQGGLWESTMREKRVTSTGEALYSLKRESVMRPV